MKKAACGGLCEGGIFFLSPYFQNTKSRGIYCQISRGILACKWSCISVCYFRQGGRALTRFPQKGRKCDKRSISNRSFAFSHEGKRILMPLPTVDPAIHPTLTLVDNWQAAMRK
jgi:hypothetical protein